MKYIEIQTLNNNITIVTSKLKEKKKNYIKKQNEK